MSIYQCPKGHESTESDYCSECGVKINGSSELAIATNSVTSKVLQTAAVQGVQTCPDCTAPHEADSGDFCEICGYNFITGSHGEVPPVALSEATIAKPSAPPPTAETNNQVTNGAGITASIPDPVTPNTSSRTAQQTEEVALLVVVTIDPSLYEEGSPPPPANQPPITFQLDKPTSLIGRRSDRRVIYPEIPLDFDDAVSHRHALLIRQPDGTFVLRDIGSSNGTKLNGVELAAMVDAPIKAGDEFTLGHWTRMIVKAAHLQEEQT
jgi:hypothetical protein